MVQQLTREQIARHAEVHAAPPVHQVEVDRTFELPTGLYAATVGLLFAYLGVMGFGFASPALAIPFAIFGIFIVGFFGLGAVWTKIAPTTKSKPLTWGLFRNEGVMTAYGRVSARDASVQVLILPVLIFLWGVAVVTIAALV